MSDAGGEYKSKAFITLLKDQGIKFLQSVPYTPQQNGRVERFNRTIIEKLEAMCHDACLPDSWWEFSIQHAAYLYNLTPVACLEWHTLVELISE